MRKFLASLLSEKRIAGGALVLAVTQLLASVCGFLRDRAFSTVFPLDRDPLGIASIYIAAFRPSDLLFQITVMSSLSVVVVPFLASHLAHKRQSEMNNILTSAMIIFAIFFGSIALVLGIFFPRLAPHLTEFKGESLLIYIQFGRIALLTNFLFVFGNALGQYQITMQRYWMYGITPIIWSLSTIAGTYLCTPFIGPMGPITGTLIGTVLYVLCRGISAYKAGYRLSINQKILHPELCDMGLLIIPRMVALGALQIQLLLIDKLASGLGQSMVALNQFASNFESVIPGIVGIALAQSVFSLFSQASAIGEKDRLRELVQKALTYNLLLAVPGAIVLASVSSIAGWLMKLEGASLTLFMSSLVLYAIAVPFESTNHVLLRAFYALKNTTTPAVSTAVSAAAAIFCANLFMKPLGLQSLAIAYVVGQMTHTVILGSALLKSMKNERRAE